MIDIYVLRCSSCTRYWHDTSKTRCCPFCGHAVTFIVPRNLPRNGQTSKFAR